MFSNLIQKLLQNLPQKAAPPPAFATPTLNQNATSIFDLIRAPQQGQFNVTPATGSKPKNYTPVKVGMSGIPVASVFAMPGANPLPQQVFNVTPASGSKPKNYKPTQVSMSAPQLAGPVAMQQMLALMGGLNPTPFAPNGQG